MKRTLISLFISLSLALFALTITLWIRSYSGSDYISRNQAIKIESHAVTSHRYALTVTRGSIRFSSELHTYYPGPATIPADLSSKPGYWGYGRLGVGHWHWDDAPASSFWNKMGFYTYETGLASSFSDSNESIIAIPAALAAILFAVPSLLFLRRTIKHYHRRRAGICPRCGYDLRATPAQCPECGQVITA